MQCLKVCIFPNSNGKNKDESKNNNNDEMAVLLMLWNVRRVWILPGLLIWWIGRLHVHYSLQTSIPGR